MTLNYLDSESDHYLLMIRWPFQRI